MSDHRFLAGSLAFYAAGALDAAERERVEEHLAGCEACREQLVSVRRFAELGLETPTEHALEHVAPGLLVEYAENPERLDEETRMFIEGRMEDCATCREAYANLEQAGRAQAPDVPIPAQAERQLRRGSIWDWLAATLLRPAPALAYLLIAAVGLPALWYLRAPGDPVAAVQVVRLSGERAQRDGRAQAAPLVIDVEDAQNPLLVELLTELQIEDLRQTALSFVLELSLDGRVVWSGPREAGTFTLRDGRGVLPLVLDPRVLEFDREYRLAIRVVRPGDPLDGQALFVRHLHFRKK